MIAIVDDEKDILELVSIHLNKSGYKTAVFETVSSFLSSLEKTDYELIVLDLMLPDGDGLEVCKKIKSGKKTSRTAVIMLTAKNDETDKIVGLELGADDYVTKPFSPKELVARVKAVLRRNADNDDKKDSDEKSQVAIKGIKIDTIGYGVTVDGLKVEMTTTEFKILLLLCSSPGRVYSREQILDHLWGQEKYVIDRTIDVHIKHLREKLKDYGSLIKNIRGVGYKIEGD